MSDGWQGREFMYRWQFFSGFAWPLCYNGKPPDKAVTFLMAKNTAHTNQENSAILGFNVDIKFWTYGIVTLEV